MKLSGSRIIIETLLEQGVDTVFGYPGGAIMPLYDALYDAPIRHVLTVHEQGSSHAADGYARASGRVGVCIATSGPGATNLVTGLATAYMDSSPVVAITGQVGTPLLGRDAFQEIDITGLTMPVTKHNFLVRSVADLAEVMRSAFEIAREGRPGPVLVDVPRDILLAETDFTAQEFPAETSVSFKYKKVAPNLRDIEQAAAALAKASRPVILVGGGIIRAEASSETIDFCQAAELPVVTTLMGLGALPSAFPLLLGLTGMHGHRAANQAVASADLILAVGTRFSDRVTSDRLRYVKDKTIIHLDVDAAEIGKNIGAEISIVGSLRESLSLLTERLRSQPAPDRADWLRQIRLWQKTHAPVYDTETLQPSWMMRRMSTLVGDSPTLWVTDVGQHQMWAAQHLLLKQPRSWITSGGLGTMGFGLPAALGAKMACPDQRVILIAGDGGFKMTGLELYTAALEKTPLLCVIVNNRSLGMVRQWQNLFFQKRYSATTLPDFDFVALARSCGVEGTVVDTPQEFDAAFQQALLRKEPYVLVANISPDCMVEPMVRPGQSVDQFMDI